MSSFITSISVAGAVASIVAMALAFWAAHKAKNSATKASLLRDEMIGKRKLTELSRVLYETHSILRCVAAIGPAADLHKLTGINSAEIASQVSEYAVLLSEQRAHYTHDFVNRAEDLINDLRQDVEQLSEAIDSQTIKAIGTRIHFRISEFLPVAKQLSDEGREGGPTN